MTKFNILSITTAIAIALSSITAFAGPILQTEDNEEMKNQNVANNVNELDVNLARTGIAIPSNEAINQSIESDPEKTLTDTQKDLQQDPELNEMAENKAETITGNQSTNELKSEAMTQMR